MVSYKEIQASNALLNDTTAPRVAVFVGGTSGIGKATIKALVSTGASTRIYLIGRKNSHERSLAFIRELNAINPKAEIVWTEAEVSLLAEGKRVCELIASRESRVDLLFMTTGYAPFGPREETKEGIELNHSLSYYTRMLFTMRLLPLLRVSESSRVVSVLSGGMEKMKLLNLDDLDLQRPGSFNFAKSQTQNGILNTVCLDKMAADNPGVAFVHSWPGWVNTGNVRRGNPGFFETLLVRFVDIIIRLFGATEDVSGQKHLFQSTSAAFGGRGTPWNGKPAVDTMGRQEADGGLYLMNFRCNSTPNLKEVGKLREKAQDKIWEHTQEVLRPYL